MKTQFHVVGGVYRERCRLPVPSDETWGSGGRAAAVLAGLGLSVTLHTVLDQKAEKHMASMASAFGFNVKSRRIKVTKQFQYEHGLSTPVIWPSTDTRERVQLKLKADSALVFGMLEGTSDVRAACIVYDPQNPLRPEPFKLGARSSTRIAYVLNFSEAKRLAGNDNPEAAARAIRKKFGPEVVVIKRGPHGALVLEKSQIHYVPAFKTNAVWPIGSGDVFAAVFAAKWACESRSALEAASCASRAAALYVNSRVLPIRDADIHAGASFPFEPLHIRKTPLTEGEYHVYLAGPFFNISQRWLVEESRLALNGMGLRVFSPLHDIGLGDANDVAPKDLEGLKKSRAVFALVDGLDAGTIFEIGYARSLGKPVVILTESTPEEPLKMMTGSECDVVSDFVSSLYRVAWASQS